jgi:hypothetical protein
VHGLKIRRWLRKGAAARQESAWPALFGARQRVGAVVESSAFKSTVGTLVIANSILIGVEVGSVVGRACRRPPCSLRSRARSAQSLAIGAPKYGPFEKVSSWRAKVCLSEGDLRREMRRDERRGRAEERSGGRLVTVARAACRVTRRGCGGLREADTSPNATR